MGKVKDQWLNAKDFHPSGKSLILSQNMTRRDVALLKASLINRVITAPLRSVKSFKDFEGK